MHSTYFTPATFKFLRALDRNNSRDWFAAHKDDYERDVRDPSLQLIADIAAPLAKISPHYRADARKNGGSLYRIYRDTRFSNNKLPYKPWQGARFFHERRHEIPAPSFYLHIQPGDCFAGGGMWHPESDALKRIRAFLADNPAAWKRATRGKAFRERFTFWGESLSRPPRGFDPGHELIEDIKRKDFATSSPLDDRQVCGPDFMKSVLGAFRASAPFVQFLSNAIGLG
jgi:uncharacterized protein (TIGR02453 family)